MICAQQALRVMVGGRGSEEGQAQSRGRTLKVVVMEDVSRSVGQS